LRYHPYLHSFPPRRSSDLVGLGGSLAGFALLTGGHEVATSLLKDAAPVNCHRGSLRHAHTGHLTAAHDTAGVGGIRQTLESACLDRKSTRLNSSHVKISYA